VLDLAFVALVIVFFAAATLYVRGCSRIVAASEEER